eukprot:COSAG02_NODE_402_length_23060_cov_58.831105_11_plen_137_part_00
MNKACATLLKVKPLSHRPPRVDYSELVHRQDLFSGLFGSRAVAGIPVLVRSYSRKGLMAPMRIGYEYIRVLKQLRVQLVQGGSPAVVSVPPKVSVVDWSSGGHTKTAKPLRSGTSNALVARPSASAVGRPTWKYDC